MAFVAHSISLQATSRGKNVRPLLGCIFLKGIKPFCKSDNQSRREWKCDQKAAEGYQLLLFFFHSNPNKHGLRHLK